MANSLTGALCDLKQWVVGPPVNDLRDKPVVPFPFCADSASNMDMSCRISELPKGGMLEV